MKIVLHSSCVTKLEIIAVFAMEASFLTFWMSGMTCYLASIITDEKYNDKLTSVCYNQLKALYFCKYDTTAYFSGVYHFEEGRPLRIFRQRRGNFQCFMLPVNSRKIEMSDVKTLREKAGCGDFAGFYISIQYFNSISNFPAHTRRGG